MKRCCRSSRPYFYRIALVLTIASTLALAQRAGGPSAGMQDAVAAMQRQDFKGAEQKLRAELLLHPNDAETLSLLGIALDQQRRIPEAAEFHKRAVANAPRSTAALYNYANHLLAAGDEKGARETLLKAVAIDPQDRNANMGLAQMALNRKDGAEAVTYLDKVKDVPETAILRLTALDLAGDRAAAATLFAELTAASQADAKRSSDYGWALARAGQFEQAETFLTNALALEPSNFQTLYGLGVTASQAGHNERAKGVLEAALRQQPKNVDVMYALALVDNALSQPEPAIRLLAEAGQLAPQRADVQKVLAVTARNIKADEDSVAAWGRYLKLVPNDDEARREQAFGKARLALLDEAMPELQRYVTRHPDDPTGHYELGMALSVNEPEKAIASLDRAVKLKPDFVAARAGRGILLYTQNQPEAAVPDLEFALRSIPDESAEQAAMLDRLGQAYVAVNRLKDAIPVLRKAARLSPDDPTTQLHLANALAESGQTEESDALMAHFRQMRPGTRQGKVAGLVDYLSLTPEARHELYRTRLEKAVHDRPEDVTSRLLYLKFLLSEGQAKEAAAVARDLVAMKPGAKALADAGHASIEARQYSVAKGLLEEAAKADASADVRLDMAIATFHAADAGAAAADAGLKQLDQVAEAGRNGGYYVARAEMLDASGKPADAIAAMDKALAVVPGDTDLYWRAAMLMTRNQRGDDALRLLDQGAKTAVDGAADIAAIRAAVLELSGKSDGALELLKDAQRRWPEAASVWVAQGVILAAHGQGAAAKTALESAVVLGAHSAQGRTPGELFLSGPPREW